MFKFGSDSYFVRNSPSSPKYYQKIKLIVKTDKFKIWIARHKLTKKLSFLKVHKFGSVKEVKILSGIPVFISTKKLNCISCLCLAKHTITGSLFQDFLIDRVVLSESESRFYIAEIIIALEALHSRDIPYLTLNPSQIFLDSDGHVKLIPKLQPESPLNLDLSYAPPEVVIPYAYSQKIDRNSGDWWSLGVILYRMLFGFLPFGECSSPFFMEKIINMSIEWNNIGIVFYCKD